MPIPTFGDAEFEVFDIPEFGARMAGIRGDVRPKLVEIGEALREPLAEILGGPVFPHTASHMRRTVNPPEETWVAFARDVKGYKRWTHLRVAVSGRGMRVTVFVEDDADDKAQFARCLQKQAKALLGALEDPRLAWYTLARDGGSPPTTANLKARQLADLGAYLGRTKTAKFQAGVPLGRDDAALRDPARFEAWLLDAARAVAPLYRAGAAGTPG